MEALLDATDSQMAALADLVESLRAAEATLSGMQAARDGLLALAGRLAIDIAREGDHPDRGDMTTRAIAAEIGAVQRVSDRTVERRMADAAWLVDGFPEVWAAQGAGRISPGHSRVIIEAGAHLPDSDRAAYAAAVLPLAETESPNRLRPLARRIAERFQERTIDERHRDARATRRVWKTDGDDGMGTLHVHAPAVLVHGMMDRLSQMAHALHEENRRAAKTALANDVGSEAAACVDAAAVGDADAVADARSVDEIRADLLADLVLTGAPDAHDTADGLLADIRANVEITVPVLTLMKEDLAIDDAAPPAPHDRRRTSGQSQTAAAWSAAAPGAGRGRDGGTDVCPQTGQSGSPSADAVDHAPGVESDHAPGVESDDTPDVDPVHTSDAEDAGSNKAPDMKSAGSGIPRGAGAARPPALIDGVTPIDAATARLLAGAASGWTRVLTDPISGSLLAVDRYRPSPHLRRHLKARDQRCRFPSCGLAARTCDLDHNHAASTGGETCHDNLADFCRRHHMLKHHSPWNVTQLPGGVLEWNSPIGRIYIDRPPPQNTVVFTEIATETAPRPRPHVRADVEPWTSAQALLSDARPPF